MAATKYGNGNYGCTDESGKGIYVSSLTMAATKEVVEVPNHIGEVTGAVFFNEQSTINCNGATTAANAFGQTLGGVMDIASTGIYGPESGVTKYYINSVELADTNNDFQQGSFTAQGWLGVTAASATATYS